MRRIGSGGINLLWLMVGPRDVTPQSQMGMVSLSGEVTDADADGGWEAAT